jgi:acetylglutamate kinase
LESSASRRQVDIRWPWVLRWWAFPDWHWTRTLQQAIEKADTLIEALAWIREFRGKTTVIKLGGSLLGDIDALHHILLDILFMESVGMRPVVVHGGGKKVSAAMAEAGIEPRFVQGRRYTDDTTLDIVEKVLATEVNHFLADEFEKIGGRAMTLNFESTPVLGGEPLRLSDDDGKPVDLGHVGVVTSVDRAMIESLSNAGKVPFIPSMAITEDGHKLNVNADTAATKVAQELNADKLVILSDVPGVMKDPADPESIVSSLNREQALQLIADGTINGGMIPKVEACLETLDKGVRKVHIVDGNVRHSLLLEVYTSGGIGTVMYRKK